MTMSDDTCRYPSCSNAPGEQEREDYDARRYCSIECQTKWSHIKADARDAERLDANREHGPAPGRRP